MATIKKTLSPQAIADVFTKDYLNAAVLLHTVNGEIVADEHHDARFTRLARKFLTDEPEAAAIIAARGTEGRREYAENYAENYAAGVASAKAEFEVTLSKVEKTHPGEVAKVRRMLHQGGAPITGHTGPAVNRFNGLSAAVNRYAADLVIPSQTASVPVAPPAPAVHAHLVIALGSEPLARFAAGLNLSGQFQASPVIAGRIGIEDGSTTSRSFEQLCVEGGYISHTALAAQLGMKGFEFKAAVRAGGIVPKPTVESFEGEMYWSPSAAAEVLRRRK